MKAQLKVFLVIFLITVSYTVNAQSTNVSGGIYTNTTWTLANSPYIVTDTVVVFPGVTLTIEPGVVVKFDDDVMLEIRQATLIAEGTVTDSITFTSNSASPTPGIWSGVNIDISPNTININYCNFYYAFCGISGYPVNIKNSKFINNSKGCSTFRGLIDSCLFMNNGSGASLRTSISNCNISNNVKGIIVYGDYYDNSYITDCKINSNATGIELNNANNVFTIIKNCIIDSNTVVGIKRGLSYYDSITNCQVKFNAVGLDINGIDNISTKNIIENNNVGIQVSINSISIFCNKICNNITYDLKYSFPSNANFANNYWCTTDSATISAHIYDGYDNVNLGLVSFMPIDTTQCYLTGCALSITAIVTNATCDTCHNGSATGQVANGFSPYTWTWYTSPMQTTQTATGMAPGTYKLCVTDGHGCTACNNAIYIDSTNCTGFSISAYATNATCSSCNDGTAWVNVNGGTPPYAYTWYTIPMQNTATATGLTQGTYHVCVTDVYGCTVCDSVTVSTGNCSAYFYLYPDTTTLHHYYAVNMASGAPPISYYWAWGDGSYDTTAYPSHTYSTAGFYTICLTITDSVGCTNMHCDSFYLQKNTNTVLTVDVISNTITGINDNYSDNSFIIYPNPASDYLTIKFTQNTSNATIKIYNLLGELKSALITSHQESKINISDLPNGVYILEAATKNNIIRKKFIKRN